MPPGEPDSQTAGPVGAVHNADASGAILLVCEHASNAIPSSLRRLGLDDEVLMSHAAWDPGALAVAMILSRDLDAPLVASTVSRLAYDCNRPPDASDAIPEKSEVYSIPGNTGLSPSARMEWVERYYQPFEALIRDTVAATRPIALATIHSFTPRVLR